MTDGTRGRNGAGLRILVVGAGIAGLGAARALRQRGFAADSVEPTPPGRAPGRVSTYQATPTTARFSKSLMVRLMEHPCAGEECDQLTGRLGPGSGGETLT